MENSLEQHKAVWLQEIKVTKEKAHELLVLKDEEIDRLKATLNSCTSRLEVDAS